MAGRLTGEVALVGGAAKDFSAVEVEQQPEWVT